MRITVCIQDELENLSISRPWCIERIDIAENERIRTQDRPVSDKFGVHLVRLPTNRGFSQLRILRPHPLSFHPVFIEDAQCAETYEKSVFRFLRFLFFELS